MIQYFKNINQQTIEIDKPESGIWVNVLPPLKQEEFTELSASLDIPIDFLTDSLDIDERSRYEEDDNVKLIVIKTNSSNFCYGAGKMCRHFFIICFQIEPFCCS